jgi:peptidoglycan/xylan/chitin deacetylase (PgdA/CDA1 family)
MKASITDRGIFIISIDLELAWGAFDLWDPSTQSIPSDRRAILLRTREVVIDELLRLFQAYQVPATWAVVGHLFLDQCQAIDGVKHPDIPRPTHRWFKDNWYARDPASNIVEDPLWYGRDILERIMAIKPQQDIGCHSFSHVIFGDEGCSAEVAEAEVVKCVTLAQEMGIELKSFVFPRSQEGHHQILRDYGFSCYRIPRSGWFDVFRGRAQEVARFLNDVLGIPPTCAMVKEKLPGLWGIPSSAYYRSVNKWGRAIPMTSRVHQSLDGLEKAVNMKCLYHLCFHPWNLAFRTDDMLDGLEKILRYADQKRKENTLDILSMAKMAKRLTIAKCQERAELSRHLTTTYIEEPIR